MYRLFQNFIDRLSNAPNQDALCKAMAEAAVALDLSCFAYLSVPHHPGAIPQLISNYPAAWTKHYLQRHYERFDPVIVQALGHPEPFQWGREIRSKVQSKPQQELFEEAAKFGIRSGFTVPIHDRRGPAAAVTFAADERKSLFERCIKENARVLQLMAMYFHAHAHWQTGGELTIDGVSLSPREFECLEWAAQGKSAWEIGHILSISRHTVAAYLENAKSKLGVRTIVQAVARLTASKSIR
jgi:DNA-binding CsgD family transcriptional regulator